MTSVESRKGRARRVRGSLSPGLSAALRHYRSGRWSLRQVTEALKDLPFRDIGFAKVDLHRNLRRGVPEVVYAEGKTPEQTLAIAEALRRDGQRVILTRLSPSAYRAIRPAAPWLRYFPEGRIAAGPFVARRSRAIAARNGFKPVRRRVPVVCAGTSDLPVAEEAAVTLDLLGFTPERIFDVGAAGLHRVLAQLKRLRRAGVVVVVAGMDGILPSVVSGLVEKPVVAVPTSVGYGATFKGVGPLLTMLNACSPGVAVVNIDNGFGAGYLAARILRVAKSA